MGGVCEDGRNVPYVNRLRDWGDLSNLRTETGVVYFNMFGTDLVVLNSSEAIADLMDKRSAIYSDKVSCHCVPRLFVLG